MKFLTKSYSFCYIQPEFLKALSEVLANPLNNSVARMAAGLQIKNALTSKDQTTKDQYQQRWLAFPEEAKTYIKNNVSIHLLNSLRVVFSLQYLRVLCIL